MPRAGKPDNKGGAPFENKNAQKNDAETSRYICNCKGVERAMF